MPPSIVAARLHPVVDEAFSHRSSVRLVRTYQLRERAASEWLDKVASAIGSRSRDAASFFGEYRLISSPDYRFRHEELAAWKADAAASWNDMLEVSCGLYDGPRSVDLRYSLHERTVTLEAVAPERAEVDEEIRTLEMEMMLERPAAGALAVSSAQGKRRRYFAREHIGPAWFERVATSLRSLTGEPLFFQGRFQLGTELEDRISPSFDAWRGSVVELWPAVIQVYCWIEGGGTRIVFDLDTRRELLGLEVQAPMSGQAEEVFRGLETDLQLDSVKVEPYRYRNFARFFEILDWKSNERFAAALREAVQVAFDRPPVLQEAFITEGRGAEDLQGFIDFELFLTRLGNVSSEYRVAYCYLQGTHGHDLGVRFDRDRSRLELRASMERKDFTQVAEAFSNALDLKLLKKVDRGKNAEGEDSKKESTWLKVVLALIAFAGGLLSAEILKEARPRYEVEILHPRTRESGPTLVQGPEVRVEWEVQESRWWDRREKPELSRAQIRIFDRSAAVIGNLDGQRPGTRLRLAPGSYEIEVRVPELGKRDAVEVQIEGPPPPGHGQVDRSVPPR